MNDLDDCIVLGRKIGMCKDWDQPGDDFGIQFSDFVPEPGSKFPKTISLFIDYDTGKVEAYNDEGTKVIFTGDLLTMLMS